MTALAGWRLAVCHFGLKTKLASYLLHPPSIPPLLTSLARFVRKRSPPAPTPRATKDASRPSNCSIVVVLVRTSVIHMIASRTAVRSHAAVALARCDDSQYHASLVQNCVLSRPRGKTDDSAELSRTGSVQHSLNLLAQCAPPSVLTDFSHSMSCSPLQIRDWARMQFEVHRNTMNSR